MHRTTLGDFELTVVSDGTYFLDGGAFFGVVPKTMWSKKVTPDEQNRLDAGLNSLLVRTGKKNILIETGIGNKLPDRLVQIFKQPAKLLDNLHAAGVAPEDIDIVINTHLHFDHCGWNTVRRGDQVRRDVSEREVLRAEARVGAWPPATGARRDQLHEPELRSAD